MSSAAMTFSLSSPIALTALSLAARASQSRAAGKRARQTARSDGRSPTELERRSQRDLVVAQAEVFTAFRGGIEVLGEADALLGFGVVAFCAGPVGPQLDERFVKVHVDAPAHADDHRLAVHRSRAFLKVRHQIGGDEREALRIAHQRLQRGPLGFEVGAIAASRLLHPAGCASLRLSRGIPCRSALLLRQLLAFGDLFKLRVQLRQFAGVQAQLGDAAMA
jgi:hypothetical protein